MGNNKSRFDSHLIENREIRVFLSSTFSDMEAERSALVKRFNKLKLEANKRNVSLTLLDLRWGVTEEESRTGKVLSVCLNEIENSHPFFIGLLGSRYGYCPYMSELEKNPDLEERYPWLGEDIAQSLSITEIEMQYGVLRNQKDIEAAFFIKDTPDTLPDDSENLTSLKTKIREQKHFPVDEYKSIDDLCTKVENRILEILNKYYADSDNTYLGRERSIQRAYMNSRHKFFVQKQEDFDRLNEFLRNDERHLVVTGESGMGKSALIANWLKELEKQEDCPYNIIYHFVGNTFGGNSHEEILQHLSDEMFDLYDGLEVRLGNNESLEEKAQRYMTEAVQKGKPMLIVIDGINQISGRDNAKLLNWIPQSPRKVKYLFSTLKDDATMQTFLRREYPYFTVKPLNDEQRSMFVVEYLEKVGKRLDNNQLSRILYDPENKNTLVLKTLLEELICFGSYEHLDERIDFYLSATSIPDFFDRMLQRLEEDYEGAQYLFSLIAVSEYGLSEEELIAITGLRQIDFHLFYCAISSHLVIRNNLLTFGHQYVTDAIWSRYHLNDIDSAKLCRESIINYFNSRESPDRNRQISELAYQYYYTDDCENLYKTILSFEAFEYFDTFAKGKVLLASYWHKLLKVNPEKYQLRNYLDLPFDGIPIEELPYLKIGYFVQEYFQRSQVSLMYFQTYLQMARFAKIDLSHVIANTYDYIGIVYHDSSKYNEAIDYYQKALKIKISNGENYNLQSIAYTYELMGQTMGETQTLFNEAIMCFQLALEIYMEMPEIAQVEIARCYNNIGLTYLKNIIKDKEFGDVAIECLSKALEIYLKTVGPMHTETAGTYNALGRLYWLKKDEGIAMKYFQKALDIKKRLFGEEHTDIAIIYESIGNVYLDSKEKMEEGIDYMKKALNIKKKVLGIEHISVARTYVMIGNAYLEKNDEQEAMMYFKKALPIIEIVSDFVPELRAVVYHYVGADFYNTGDYNQAFEYWSKALSIRENLYGPKHIETASSYFYIGYAFLMKNNITQAMECWKKALNIREDILGPDHPGTKNVREIIDKIKRELEEQ